MFEYNQSNGHTKVKGDRLIESNMSVSYGGNLSIMRNGTDGDLDPYEVMFLLGAHKSIVFTSSCEGPFWMDTTEMLLTRYDIVALSHILSHCSDFTD